MTELARQFADAYREGAHGATMDADSARAVALAIDEVVADRDSLQQVFDLQWEADMRAVKRWRAAHPGNDLVLPDRANMVVWLLEEHERLLRTAGEA